MRKFFFTLLLAFIGSVWMASHAICTAHGYNMTDDNLYYLQSLFSGTLVETSLPCDDSDDDNPCLPCTTVALLTNDSNLYYLTGLDDKWQAFLDSLYDDPYIANMPTYSYHALLSGREFNRGDYRYIAVNTAAPAQITRTELWSSADWLTGAWEVHKEIVANGSGYGDIFMRDVNSSTRFAFFDSLGLMYQFMKDGTGYFPPHAYTLDHGADGWLLSVEGLFDTPRNLDGGCSPLTLYRLTDSELEWQYDSYGGDEGPVTHYQFLRRCQTNQPFAEGERVVLSGSLTESFRECTIEECPTCYGIFATSAYPVSFYSLTVTDAQIIDQLNHMPTGKLFTIEGVWLICKDTPFIEVSAIYETTSDTIPLYVNDGPGSTTVTPVDPNQVVATLNDNLLTIREQSGEEVTYSLAVTPISHAPARHALPAAQKEVSAGNFRNSVAVQLSQNGSYTLTLSKAGWENDIYGTFDYTASGLQPVAATDAPARKLLRNGQLFIQQGDKIFTLTGVQTK